MRYVKYLILAALGIVLVTVALANREPLTLQLLPNELSGLLGLSWAVTLPTFFILFGAVIFGVVLGFVWEWVREHKHRSEAASEKRLRRELEKQVKSTAPPKGETDEILALVESR